MATIMIAKDGCQEFQRELDLLDATYSGNRIKIEELLSSGLSAEAKKIRQVHRYLEAPLLIATAKMHEQCLQLLIKHGADVNVRCNNGMTPLHVAAKNGDWVCLKILLEAGADYCASIDTSFCVYDADYPYIEGTTPLHIAAGFNYWKIVKELIQFGADCNAVNTLGYTCLHIATKAGFQKTALVLLRNFGGVVDISLATNDTRDTALHYAVKNKMTECVKELVRLGADVNKKNREGFSPLHLLLFCNRSHTDMEILECLVLDGFDTNINQLSSCGHTPLYFAIFLHEDLQMATFLIAHGAKVNINTHFATAIEILLSFPHTLNILKCVVKAMPQLPRLASMDIFSHVPYPFKLALGQRPGRIYLLDRESENADEIDYADIQKKLNLNVFRRQKYIYVALPLEQPYLDATYEQIVTILAEMEDSTADRMQYNLLLSLRNELWYEKSASNPFSLQHYCRFSIRKSLGSKIRHAKDLPLPKKIISYLLLDWDK